MDGDELVRDYLGRLEAASWPLPPGRRTELAGEVREHIDTALAEAGRRDTVTVHNVLAILLAINAGLSLFYHVVSGEIRQYLPRPYGFFDDAIVQAKYYLGGIFRGQGHPFEKRPDAKLNPLQQVTYFGILNVLLPLQIVTGALMMGVQMFPQVAAWLGGLPLLAPFHSLVAWTFAAFIVGHVYLTTTGLRPLTSIRAMMNGWEEIEAHAEESAGNNPPAEKETP